MCAAAALAAFGAALLVTGHLMMAAW